MSEFNILIETLVARLENSGGWNAAALALFSVFLYVLTANVAWRIARAHASRTAAQLRALSQQRPAIAAFEILRLGYYVGLPFAALYWGWIDLRAMGLSALDWAEGARWAIVILLAAWFLLTIVWFPYLRATYDVPAAPETYQPFARRMVELIYKQAHWAFYRSAAIMLFTRVLPDAFYWGTVIGLAFVCVEAFLNPRLRAQVTRLGQADPVIWDFGQSFINALAFLATRNFLLLVLIHFLLELSVPHVRSPRLAARTNMPPPPRAPRPIQE